MTKRHRPTCSRITKKTGRKHVYVKGRGCLTKRAARKARAARRRRHHR